MSSRYDFAVIGGGILGLASARELLIRHPNTRVIVLEAAPTLAAHQSGHNSGVIHAGVYYRPGSSKALLCVQGAALMYDYCERRGIDARKVGKLIIATDTREVAGLNEIERRARANGVPGIRRLAAQEISDVEPHATGVAALHSPGTGIVDFAEVCRHIARDFHGAGGELRLQWPVGEVQERGRQLRIRGPGGDAIEAGAAVFCAGLEADRLAARAGGPPGPRILPFRGAYLRLRPERRGLVRGLIYPVPDPALPFLGVHLTPRVDGEVLLGPSALLVASREAYRVSRVRPGDLLDTLMWPGTWRMMGRWWRTGLSELRLAASRRVFAAQAARYVPDMRAADLEPGFAGVRAQPVGRDGRLLDDFLITESPRAVHVLCAPSPAATSSLALAKLIVDALLQRLG